MKKVSFCITCKNRFYQISKTLPANLEANKQHKDWIEFVLVDFDSKDGLQSWVLSNFKEAMDDGYLNYFHTEALPNWHGSIAKNTSHYWGTGDFLINLDGDNFTGAGGGNYVWQLFNTFGETLLLHQFDGNWNSGNYGRIGMHKKYFELVGGYDESLDSMGHEDMDLINRLSEIGLNYKRYGQEQYTKAIWNTREESVQYAESKLSWRSMEIRNAKRSRTNLRTGKVIANNVVYGIRNNIMTYKNGTMIPVDQLKLNPS